MPISSEPPTPQTTDGTQRAPVSQDAPYETVDVGMAALRGLAHVFAPAPIATPIAREEIAALLTVLCRHLETGLSQLLQASTAVTTESQPCNGYPHAI